MELALSQLIIAHYSFASSSAWAILPWKTIIGLIKSQFSNQSTIHRVNLQNCKKRKEPKQTWTKTHRKTTLKWTNSLFALSCLKLPFFHEELWQVGYNPIPIILKIISTQIRVTIWYRLFFTGLMIVSEGIWNVKILASPEIMLSFPPCHLLPTFSNPAEIPPLI